MRQVGYLQRLYRDARSTEHKKREPLVVEVNMHERDTGYSPGRKYGIYFNYNLFHDTVSSSAIQCRSRIIRELTDNTG